MRCRGSGVGWWSLMLPVLLVPGLVGVGTPGASRAAAAPGSALLADAAPADERTDEATPAGAVAEEDAAHQARLMALYDQMVRFNLDQPETLPSAQIDARMREYADLAMGERIAAWAKYFAGRTDVTYRFGLRPEGYVSAGRLIDDFHTDCVLFAYRVTELGRSSSALEAVQFAFGTRFYGAALEEVVDGEGRVDYENPVHLDFTIDMIRSGIWGREITTQLGASVPDTAGSTRYGPGSVRYVPTAALRSEALRSGDVVYFISDEATPRGRRLRETGALIGHLGIVLVEEGRVDLIHAASQGLPGLYEGGRVVRVPLTTYLERVETFKGLLATRIESF